MSAKKRNLFIRILFGCFLLSAVFFCICACSSDSEPESVKITLNLQAVTIAPDETCELKATVVNSEEAVVWASSDTAVATISGGVVTGIKEGTANITASIGEAVATCVVTVEENGVNPGEIAFPVLSLSQYDAKLRAGLDSVTVTPELRLLEEEIAIEDINYVSSDTAKVTVTKNADNSATITAVAASAEEVYITASLTYDGQLLERKVTVIVINDVELTLVDELKLYTYDNNGALNADGIYEKMSAVDSFLVSSVDGDLTALDWTTDNASVAEINEGLVTAVGEGTATVTATYTDVDGMEYQDSVYVVVAKTVLEYDAEPQDIYMNAEDGGAVIDPANYGFSIETADAVVLKDVTDEESEPVMLGCSVQDGKMELETNNLVGGNRTFLLEEEKVDRTFNVVVITKVIETADELINLRTYGGVTDTSLTTYSYGGYYILGNNIDMTGKTVTHMFVRPSTNSEKANCGFTGTFDGRGFTVYGGTYGGNGGILGRISKNAVIKNVAFVNSFISGVVAANMSTISLFGTSIYGELSDVLVVATRYHNGYEANQTYKNSTVNGLAGSMYCAKLTNVVVSLTNDASVGAQGIGYTFATSVLDYNYLAANSDGNVYTAADLRGTDFVAENVYSFGGRNDGVMTVENTTNGSACGNYRPSSAFLSALEGHLFTAATPVTEAIPDAAAAGFGEIWDMSGTYSSTPLFASSAEFFAQE